MDDQTDSQLLCAYAENRSDEAFAALVRRHIDLVHSAALRMVNDSHLAQDVTQNTFVALAKNATELKTRPVIAGWLHRTAQNIAAQTVRTDVRRRNREQEATTMNTLLSETSNASWQDIAPHLDAALSELDEPDRDAVLLRYFEKKSARVMAVQLSISDDAAQKRVSRAVERLREFFAKRGVTVGAGGLVVVISANAVQAAPMGMATTVSLAALAQGTTVTSTSAIVAKGFWKPALTTWPLIGSMYFLLKAEVESARSPRERQFLIRMIWLRYAIAALILVLPALCEMTMPSVFKTHADFTALGMVVGCYCLAIFTAVRTMYFHRQRRWIQIEEGTSEAFSPGEPTRADDLMSDLLGKSSKANSYAALSAVFGFIACLGITCLLVTRMLNRERWIMALLLTAWGMLGCFRCLRNWRQRPRQIFDGRFSKVAKTTILYALMSLVFFNLLWAKGRLPFAAEWGLTINFIVLAAYVVLIRLQASWHSESSLTPVNSNRATPK